MWPTRTTKSSSKKLGTYTNRGRRSCDVSGFASMENPPTCIRAPVRIRPNEADNGTRYCKKAAVHHPRGGWGRRPCGIRRGDCAICGWRFGTMGDFAPCAAREFRPLRRATRVAASGLRDLGCSPPVGKSGRRGILRQGKVWLLAILDVWQEAAPPPWRKRPGEHRRHTGGGQPSQEKNRVKLFNVWVCRREQVRTGCPAPRSCGPPADRPWHTAG